AILSCLGRDEIARYRNWCAARAGNLCDSDRAFADISKQGYAIGETGFSGQAPIAFPVVWAPGWAGAIAIEGPVFTAQDKTRPAASDWRIIVNYVETLARAQPAIFENPF